MSGHVCPAFATMYTHLSFIKMHNGIQRSKLNKNRITRRGKRTIMTHYTQSRHWHIMKIGLEHYEELLLCGTTSYSLLKSMMTRSYCFHFASLCNNSPTITSSVLFQRGALPWSFVCILLHDTVLLDWLHNVRLSDCLSKKYIRQSLYIFSYFLIIL